MFSLDKKGISLGEKFVSIVEFSSYFLSPMSLNVLLGFLRWLKHLCLCIEAPNTYIDTLKGHYVKLVFH